MKNPIWAIALACTVMTSIFTSAALAQQYRAALDFIAAPPADCAVLEVAPPRPLATGRTTQTLDTLEQDYALGWECGHAAARGWTALGAVTAAPARVA